MPRARRTSADFDKLIVAIGRVPNTAGLNAEAVGPRARRARLRRVDEHAARTCRTSTRSATWCAGRCSRTRPRKRAWRWPSSSPGSRATSTSTPCRGSSTPRPRSPGSARPSRQLKAEASHYRAGSFPSRPTAARARWARPARLRQDSRRRGDRPHPRRAHHRAVGLGADRRSRGGDGVRRERRGHRAHRATRIRRCPRSMHEAALGGGQARIAPLSPGRAWTDARSRLKRGIAPAAAHRRQRLDRSVPEPPAPGSDRAGCRQHATAPGSSRRRAVAAVLRLSVYEEWIAYKRRRSRAAAPGRAAAAAARASTCGARRARQELPDGQLLPDACRWCASGGCTSTTSCATSIASWRR